MIMQIGGSGKWEHFRNRGYIYFPPLYKPERESHHYKEPAKSRSQIMKFRRVRKYMRPDLRKQRRTSYGIAGLIIRGILLMILAVFMTGVVSVFWGY